MTMTEEQRQRYMAVRKEMYELMAEEGKEWHDQCVVMLTVSVPSTATDDEMLAALAEELKRTSDATQNNPKSLPFRTTVRRHIVRARIDHEEDAYVLEPDMDKCQFEDDKIIAGTEVFWRRPSKEFGRGRRGA